MRRLSSYRVAAIAGVAASAMLLTACGSDDNGNTNPPGSSGSPGSSSSGAGGSGLKIGLAYDIGGRGDKSFNDSAAAGLDAAKQKYNLSDSDVKELEAAQGEAEADKEARLTQLADNGFTSIIAVGFAYADAIKAVVGKYPNVKFAIIDDNSVQAPNLADLTFAEEQGSFLVGAIAALKSTKHHVGFIGGVNVPLIQKFQAGFDAGAKAADPSVKLEDKYLTQPPDFGGFNDPTKGETAANGIYDAGADVIFAAAGGSGSGVFKAAKAKNSLAIGTDSDQYQSAADDVKDVVISSMLKRVDVAVGKFIDSVKDGSFKAGNTIFDLKAGGVDYSTSGGKIDDIKDKVDDFKAKIIDGTITVPTK
ncbi:MAG TPA: BMP family ABC transporter substrate-binding protein [Jatrophihabitans sp.]|nr:BMP family ABC transporter substrate-binding protein [Jatrophihabitans sp.]